MTDKELNARIAEKVMEIKLHPAPNYCNDIAAAWQVWEHLKGSDFWGEFLDAITPDGYYEGMYDLSPRVICLAALEAVG